MEMVHSISSNAAHPKYTDQSSSEGYSWGDNLSEERGEGDETASHKAKEDVGGRGESTVVGVTAGGSGSRRLRATAGAARGPRAGTARASKAAAAAAASAGRGS